MRQDCATTTTKSSARRPHPRISGGLSLGRIRGRVAYGEAFRAPSVGDLYYPFYGNAELGAETSQSWEAGLDWTGDSSRVSLTWFHNDIDDLIVFDPVSNRLANVGSAVTSGLELGGSVRAGMVRIDGSWTILDTEDRATGLELLRRPEQSGALSIGWERGVFAGLISALYSGDRADFQSAFPFGRVTNDAYTVVDMDLRMGHRSGLTPYLKIREPARRGV